MSSSLSILVVLVIYIGGMLAVGVHFRNNDGSQEEFLLGGKKIPGWILALSERSTTESAWLVLGASGFVYAYGMQSIWLIIASIVGAVLAWLVYAKPYQENQEKYDTLTTPGILAGMFGDQAKVIRLIIGTMIGIFFTLFLAAQISGAGVTLNTVLGLDKTIAMVVVIFVVILLTRIGGFATVVYTDALQAVLMLTLFIILPVACLVHINSAGLDISARLAEAPAGYDSFTAGLKGFAFIAMFLANFSYILVYAGGSAQVNSRYMALKTKKDRAEAAIVASVWVIVAYVGTFVTGILAMVIYGGEMMGNPETIVPFMVVDLLPPWLSGVLIAAVLAAIISTADSFLLLVSSAISEDIVKIGLGKEVSEKKLVQISKYTIVVVGVIAFFIALLSKSLVFTIVSWYVAGLAVPLSAVVTLAFFWKKTTGIGVVASLIIGFVSNIIYSYSGLEAVLTGRVSIFIICLVSCAVISLMTQNKTVEATSEKA